MAAGASAPAEAGNAAPVGTLIREATVSPRQLAEHSINVPQQIVYKVLSHNVYQVPICISLKMVSLLSHWIFYQSADLLKDPQIRSRSTDPIQFLKMDLDPQIQSTFLNGSSRSRSKGPIHL